MAVSIRLARHGRRHRPVYFVVAADTRYPRDGRFIEKLGTYIPYTDPTRLQLSTPRALYWLSQGAQPTSAVRRLLTSQGVMLQRHLQVGINKGKVTKADAARRLAVWQEAHGTKWQQRVKRISPSEGKVEKVSESKQAS